MQQIIQELWETTKSKTDITEIAQKKQNTSSKNNSTFPQLDVRHQTTGPGNSKNTKRKYQKKKLHLGIPFSNCKKSTIKKRKKEKKPAEEKHLTYTGLNIRITSDISESMQHKRKWSKIVLRENNHQPTMYPVKLFFKSKEEREK